MTEGLGTADAPPKRSILRRGAGAGRLLRWILGLALTAALVPILLVPLYLVVPPVSTLMLAAWVSGQPVDRRWRDLSAISPALPLAVAASEDARFCAHGGVDWEALRGVIEDAEGGRPDRGASTITMQTAKNLFLWPQQSYLRKGLEIGLALYIDAVWSKRRLMEVYLNIAEWGPGIFGAEAAAQRHFRKSAAALTPREAALLAASLPNPFDRVAGRAGPGLRRLASMVAARARASGPLFDCLDVKRR